MPPTERCERCRFWQRGCTPHGRMLDFGACRVDPPKIIGTTMTPVDNEMVLKITRFPQTREMNWCGRFESEDGSMPC